MAWMRYLSESTVKLDEEVVGNISDVNNEIRNENQEYHPLCNIIYNNFSQESQYDQLFRQRNNIKI